MSVIKVAEQFTRTPGGRYRVDGPFSGEEFREQVLIPALSEGSGVIVDFDGVLGLSASFLEEAFGGLIRKFRLEKPKLLERIQLRATRPYLQPYLSLTYHYMREA